VLQITPRPYGCSHALNKKIQVSSPIVSCVFGEGAIDEWLECQSIALMVEGSILTACHEIFQNVTLFTQLVNGAPALSSELGKVKGCDKEEWRPSLFTPLLRQATPPYGNWLGDSFYTLYFLSFPYKSKSPILFFTFKHSHCKSQYGTQYSIALAAVTWFIGTLLVVREASSQEWVLWTSSATDPMHRVPFILFFFQPLTVRGWSSAFLLDDHRLCGAIEGRLSHFLPHWLRTGWQSLTGQGKIPWNTPPWLGVEFGLQGGQTMRFTHSPTELSWPGPQSEQTVRFAHSPTELSWPRLQRGQTVRFTHSPTELSWPGPRGGQTVRLIPFPTELSITR